jgi:serine/threonine protein kinase/Tol biopolymer transport system component
MTDRWNEVEPILDEALAREPHDRAAFIAEACAGDAALRREVESLLAREAAASGFLTTPGFVMAAESLAPRAVLGRTIGPYTIQALLGAGGMGEVYRAHDSQLDRDVAIKILPPAFADDSGRLARFAREAKTLAALNHPHIAAIYGLEDIDGVPALVLELVEGRTLAERLAEGPLPLQEALDIARQIAEALEAAHGREIIHRDLKPANITITHAGSVKLLDFGLAKGLRDRETGEASRAADSPLTTSSPGALLGTAAYMSPEQATGQVVDSRSDLFSFGAVLYEMLTGQVAFTGETLQEVLAAIVTRQPPSPRTIDRTMPPGVDLLVTRLLAKDRAARHQTAHDVRVELQRLVRDLEPGSRGARRRWLEPGAAASLLVVLGSVGWISWWASSSGARVEREYTQVTHFADSATWPALSSDGRLLTFIRGDSPTATFAGRGQIYVKALPDGEPVPLTSDDLRKMSPVFSPDGSRIAYTAQIDNFNWDTWIVGVGDQAPALWLENASGLSWLSDRRVVFSEITQGLHMKVVTASERRADARPVYAPSSALGMAHRSSVSPNGAWLLIAEMDSGTWLPCRLVPVDGSSTGRSMGPDAQCTSAAWSPDGQWMYFSSNSTGDFHIWRQRFPDGVPEQITDGPTEEEGIAPDPDGRSFLTSVGSRHSSIWVQDEQSERFISREGYAFIPMPPDGGTSQPVSADGRSVYYLVRQGAVRFLGIRERVGELWAADSATGESRPLVTGRSVVGYDVSHDGARLAFAALDDRGVSRMWMVRLDRPDEPRQLAALEMDSPRFNRAGDVFCRGREDGQFFVYRLRPGTAPERVLNEPIVRFLTVSPGGDWIVASVPEDPGRSGNLINKAFPTSGAKAPVRLCHGCDIDWMPDGRSLVIRFAGADGPSSQTLMLPLQPGVSMPPFPPEGLRSKADLAGLPVAKELKGWHYPNATGSLSAFARVSTQRNIYRIALR